MCRVLTKPTRDSERERKEREEKRTVGKEHIAGEREKETERREGERECLARTLRIFCRHLPYDAVAVVVLAEGQTSFEFSHLACPESRLVIGFSY